MPNNISTPPDFWTHMVLVDYAEFAEQPGNLRRAFHCAITLYHMHDWIFVTHGAQVRTLFGAKDERHFSKYLGNNYPNFKLIDRIANSAKHLSLRSQPPARTSAANTQLSPAHGSMLGAGPLGAAPLGGFNAPRVILEATNQDVLTLATDVKGTSKNIGFPRAMAFDDDIQLSRVIFSAPSAPF